MDSFNWGRYPLSESLLLSYLEEAKECNPELRAIDQRLKASCSTTLFDFIDTLSFDDPSALDLLKKEGFSKEGDVFQHKGATFPFIAEGEKAVYLKVESLPFFLMMNGTQAEIEGAPFSSYRMAKISSEGGFSVYAVERRGSFSLRVNERGEKLSDYFQAREGWMMRDRSDKGGLDEAIRCAETMCRLVGPDLAACIVMEVEREFWQAKNLAGNTQKWRQDRLGFGFANHDHHTFRSSRKNFKKLVHLFEVLGFSSRERFYAGKEAGWGAQVMENLRANLVLFLDVDLDEEELMIDFSKEELKETENLGTIGLWCALHGDSILSAGMHHLEAQFAFDALKDDLKQLGFDLMDPFSNFTYLKQAFTKGEVWPVSHERLQALRKEGKITEEMERRFKEKGALGSHMENLQRREGYKGFNQNNVSFIIKKTDPRITSGS